MARNSKLETVLQLVVGADRKIGFLRTEAGQRHAQLVAEEAQEVEELPLLTRFAGYTPRVPD